MLRIITGKHKGKKLASLEGNNTRPTSDRIKGAMFSSIQFDIENRRVLDSEREAMDVVKANCRSLGEFERCRYAVSDWRNFIRKASGRDTYDLVFIDPPYAMECSVEAVRLLKEKELIIPGALIVVESGDEDTTPLQSMDGFELLKSTDYGKKTALNVLLYRGE